MNNSLFISDFITSRIICILRDIPEEAVIPVTKALYKGGIRFLEIAFSQSDYSTLSKTARTIKKLREYWGESFHIGAGTVLTLQQAESACHAGAEYIFSPNTDCKIITYTKNAGLISIPGAFTPSEIVLACQNGADIVKIFPASALPPDYIKNIKTPLSNIPLIAVGGINLQNITSFLKAGCIGAGIGSSILGKETISTQNYEAISDKVSLYTELIKKWNSTKNEVNE